MGSVTSLSNALAYLTEPGGVLSNLPAAISKSVLQSASPRDLVSLSVAAIQAQEADGLLGVSPNSGTAGLLAGAGVTANPNATSILPGVSSAALSNATPQEKLAISEQALLYQQAQALFDPPLATSAASKLIA